MSKPKKPMATSSLRLQVVDRGTLSTTGAPLRDLYLQCDEDTSGKPGPGFSLSLHNLSVLGPVAARLADWFRSQGVEVIEVPASRPADAPGEAISTSDGTSIG